MVGRDVVGVCLGILARCIGPVVARRAVLDDTIVIEHCRRKGTAGYMAHTAILGCGDVIRLGILAGGVDTIVAGIASVADDRRAGMVDERSGEIDRVMAYGAIPTGVLVNRGSRFPYGAKRDMAGASIVTRCAPTGNADMAEDRRRERGRRMAIEAVLIGR